MEHGQDGGEAGLAARVNAEEWFAGLHAGADFFDLIEADGKIDRVARPGAATSEGDGGATERAGIHGREASGAGRGEIVEEGSAVHVGKAFERGAVAALGFDEGDEFLPRRAIVQPGGELGAGDVGDAFREIEGEGSVSAGPLPRRHSTASMTSRTLPTAAPSGSAMGVRR